MEVDRWLFTRPIDSLNRQRVLDNYDLFPPHFRRLIRARLELTDRLDALRLATEEWDEYYYAWWLRGEEELNRGPLFGRLRTEAAVSLQRAAVLRPQFAPTWWDLTWIYIAEGDREGATTALQSVPEPLDHFSRAIGLLLQIAYGYRFGVGGPASRGLQQIFQDSTLAGNPNLLALPRLMPSFDTPEGAVELGGAFASVLGRPDIRRSGLIAQLFGFFAMGRMDAVRDRSRRYARDFPGDEFPLFVAELEAVNNLFDSARTDDLNRIAGQLRRYSAPDAGTPGQRRSARWMLQLLRQEIGTRVGTTTAVQIDDSTNGLNPLAVVLEANRLALADSVDEALKLAGTLRRWEITEAVPHRFFRTVLHFLMADWYEQQGNLQAAVEALRWHEAFDLAELPREAPVAQEIDWAFGTLARWRRARLLDRMSDTGGETCSAYGTVARLWREGDGEYARRAREARARFNDLACG